MRIKDFRYTVLVPMNNVKVFLCALVDSMHLEVNLDAMCKTVFFGSQGHLFLIRSL